MTIRSTQMHPRRNYYYIHQYCGPTQLFSVADWWQMWWRTVEQARNQLLEGNVRVVPRHQSNICGFYEPHQTKTGVLRVVLHFSLMTSLKVLSFLLMIICDRIWSKGHLLIFELPPHTEASLMTHTHHSLFTTNITFTCNDGAPQWGEKWPIFAITTLMPSVAQWLKKIVSL